MTAIRRKFPTLAVNQQLGPLAARLADLVDAGGGTPCTRQAGTAGSGPGLWLSDSVADRRQAAELCRGCPILTPCREAGQSERWGVWGGRDRTPTTNQGAADTSDEPASPDLQSSGPAAFPVVSAISAPGGHKHGHSGVGIPPKRRVLGGQTKGKTP
ncbi:WhiB family transcriptional regulator [Enemella sp. A6]|uniref:WhiB family transcriptional regulator n=1 Tax=Enemella sp. A6 TaxID=3440152 RepID=UPI003EC0A8EE